MFSLNIPHPSLLRVHPRIIDPDTVTVVLDTDIGDRTASGYFWKDADADCIGESAKGGEPQMQILLEQPQVQELLVLEQVLEAMLCGFF